jgi:flavodoxin
LLRCSTKAVFETDCSLIFLFSFLNQDAFENTEDLAEKIRKERQEELDRQMALAFENEMKGNALGLRASTEGATETQPTIPSFFPPEPSPPAAPTFQPMHDYTRISSPGIGGYFGGSDSGSGDEILQVLDRWKGDDALIAKFESKYGITHPEFSIGSSRLAWSRAKREFKIMMVYLHFDEHDNTDLFCL